MPTQAQRSGKGKLLPIFDPVLEGIGGTRWRS